MSKSIHLIECAVAVLADDEDEAVHYLDTKLTKTMEPSVLETLGYTALVPRTRISGYVINDIVAVKGLPPKAVYALLAEASRDANIVAGYFVTAWGEVSS